MTLVVHTSWLPVPPETLFGLHMDATNLPAISPSFPPVTLLSDPKRAEVGDLQVIRFGFARFCLTWHARVTQLVPGRLLEDVQERGPFLKWRHQHRVREAPGGAEITDAVSFRLIPTPAGEMLEYFLVRPLLRGMFIVRHRKTRQFLAHDKS